MVMRNRHDGAGAPQWWDDLPPGIKKRCANAPELKSQIRTMVDPSLPGRPTDLSSSRLGIVRDLSWLALLFVAIIFADLLFILLAVSFLYGHTVFTH